MMRNVTRLAILLLFLLPLNLTVQALTTDELENDSSTQNPARDGVHNTNPNKSSGEALTLGDLTRSENLADSESQADLQAGPEQAGQEVTNNAIEGDNVDPVMDAEEPKRNILLLGDSLSSAYNIKQSEGWVHLLSEKLNQIYPDFAIINAATSGDTTQNALQQINAKLKEYKPEIVIIEIGGNDGLRGFPIPTIKRNVEKLIKTSLDHAKVMLVGIQIPPNYGRLYTEQFKQLYFDLAKQYEVAFLPFLLEDVALEPGFMQKDGIHPTAEAQPQVMANAWQYLEPLLQAKISKN